MRLLANLYRSNFGEGLMRWSLLAGLAVLGWGVNAQAQNTDLLRKFDSQLSSKDQTEWLKLLSAEPNQVGSRQAV